MTIVAVIDKTGRISSTELNRAVASFQIQFSRDSSPAYGGDAQIMACQHESEAPTGTWFT